MKYSFQRRVECVLVRRDEVEVGDGSTEEVDAARERWEATLASGTFHVKVENVQGARIGTLIQTPDGEIVFAENSTS